MHSSEGADSLEIPKESATCEICAVPRGVKNEASGWDFEYGTCREEFQIVRCASCGLVYLENRPSAEAMGTIYPPHYYTFDESNNQSKLVKTVRDWLEGMKVALYVSLIAQGEHAVLDVGCGSRHR